MDLSPAKDAAPPASGSGNPDAAPQSQADGTPDKATGKPAPVTPQGKTAEKLAANTAATLNTTALPVKQYLEAVIVPVLMQGLQQLVRERPEDPVEYLAAYLTKNNPKKNSQPQADAPAGPP
jgi:protein dpy-30